MSSKSSLNTVIIKQTDRYTGIPITETLTNGFFIVDKKWTVKYWNKAAEKLLNVRSCDIVGFNLWERFAGILPLDFYTVYQKAFQGDQPVHFEEYWGEMGAWFDVITYYCDDTLSVSFKSSNHPHSEYSQDPVKKLRTLTELYRFVTEITNDALWEWNFDAEEMFWIDGGHKRIFGYQIENALIPLHFWESRIHPEDKERVLAKISTTISSGTADLWEDEYRFAKADNSYAYVCDRGHIIYENNKPYRMVGATQDITARIMLEKELEKSRLSKQREITTAVLAAQERERLDIGFELQENLGQMLVAAGLYLHLAKSDNKTNFYLDRSADYIKDILAEIKKISRALIVPNQVIGLFANISLVAKETFIQHKLQVDFWDNCIDDNKIDQALQLHIFRIIQEQLNNIVQHAEATHTIIDIKLDKGSLLLYIKDNGKGYDTTEKDKGLGIINMTTRVELLGGSITITSKPREGTIVKILLPLDMVGV